MQKNYCENPNCNKCLNRTPNQMIISDSIDADYLPENQIRPEILESHQPSNTRLIEEPNYSLHPHNCRPIDEYDHIMPEDFTYSISDGELLNYLLQKYHLNKEVLINSIIKQRENQSKINLLKDFYNQFKKIGNKSIKEQYHIFKEWNNSNLYVKREELENYYEKYIKLIM